MRKIKFLVYLYQLYVWLIYIPSMAFWVMFMGTIAILLNLTISIKAGSTIPRAWGWWHCFIIPAKIKIFGTEYIDNSQSYIIVANHESLLDIPILIGRFPGPLLFIMKHELTKVPGFGWISRNLGHIPINRDDSDSAKKTIELAKNNLVPGASIAFFPEGTRNDSGILLPFKKGAFRLAIDLQLPILPVSISGTKEILPGKSLLLFPGKATIRFHKPIAVQSYNNDLIDQLVEKTRLTIQKGLDASK